ncbi:hypothetical protein CPB84DRAFT_833107 [Gymnopilus junonius]|uniref:Uncharacterized protein n=1 Tax=Gymnopilus junonius TaxID=109634 RepID=A0A9P5NT03_GYMJU|nr:hypothetical protein CPB84DRAFT_833107 [Gymnopilus junonius]
MPLVSPDGLISFDPYDPSAPSTALRSPDLDLLDSGFNPNMGYPSGMGDLSSSSQEARDREHEERMHRQWQGAEDVDKEMSMVDSSIQSLIQTFGLDPSLLEDHVNANANLNLVHSLGPSVGLDDSGGGHAGDAPIDYTDMAFLSDDPSGSPTTTAPTPTPTAPTAAPSTNSNLNINVNNLPTQRDRDRDLVSGSPMQSIRHVSPSPSLSVQSDYHANADDGRHDVSVLLGVIVLDPHCEYEFELDDNDEYEEEEVRD